MTPPLATRLFRTRLDLISVLDGEKAFPEVREDIVSLLRDEVAAMNLDNFIVRPQRRLVERFRGGEGWTVLNEGDLSELATRVAGLPTQQDPEREEAKRFDLLLLSTELALMRSDPGLEQLAARVRAVASLLEGYPEIPSVKKELALIGDLQSEEWWVDVTVPMLEDARRRLRMLVRSIEKAKKNIVYADFEDFIGRGVEFEFDGLNVDTFDRFRKKARSFLADHLDDWAILKLRMNEPVTADDLTELQRIVVEAGVGTEADCERASADAGGFGLFIRRLVGLDRAAAKEAFAYFLEADKYSANQIEFVNLVIDELTASGVVEPRRLYDSPFTHVHAQGPDALFERDDVDRHL